MGQSRNTVGKRVRISSRFTDRLAAEMHQAVTHMSRGNYEGARTAWETAQQMLDTFVQESKIEEYISNGARSTTLATEVEPAQESERPAKKATKRAGTTKSDGGSRTSSDD